MKRFLFKAAASLAMISSAAAAPFQWSSGSGGNDHWYEYVVLEVVLETEVPSLTAARAEALANSTSFMGLSGCLATMTSAAEQTFLNSHWFVANSVTDQFMDYSFFLIGLTDRNAEGSFEWLGGPESGYRLAHFDRSAGARLNRIQIRRIQTG
ncbi:hypothetical protein [Labrenzia sp. DG1229]|uniref:hypothetical protein n=1 Tax=Labrenzia sp. DG1229 TaxID=681847 RepID=UPI00048CA1EE|nr:hypothetical protein [Labrenzia sp. DG1229]